MANNIWKDYLTFTKGERISVFILLGILVISIVIPYFYARKFSPPVVNTVLQKQLDSVLANTQQDSSTSVTANSDQQSQSKVDAVKLFNFDPNTLDAEGFKQLGLRDKTIQTLLNYRNKGGHFKQPEDIRKIYGLREDEADNLIPYIRIENENAGKNDNPAYEEKEVKLKPTLKKIDINTATEEEFKALPGIGDVLSKRIVKFRNSMHGFKSVDDIGKTYGLSDSTFQLILPYLTISNDN